MIRVEQAPNSSLLCNNARPLSNFVLKYWKWTAPKGKQLKNGIQPNFNNSLFILSDIAGSLYISKQTFFQALVSVWQSRIFIFQLNSAPYGQHIGIKRDGATRWAPNDVTHHLIRWQKKRKEEKPWALFENRLGHRWSVVGSFITSSRHVMLTRPCPLRTTRAAALPFSFHFSILKKGHGQFDKLNSTVLDNNWNDPRVTRHLYFLITLFPPYI
jgi:hypothetical protein